MSTDPTLTAARLVAFMDIGTNSIRLLVVRIHPDHSTTVVTQLKQMVRLGEGEFTAQQALQPEAIDRAVAVVRHFARLARSYGAVDIIAVATAATREATNQREFVRRVRREAHLDVRVVSGPEEARLIYLGVASGAHLGDKQAFFIDIGGGSTEVIIGTQHQHHYLNSLRLGAIRLTTQFLPNEQGPIAPQQYARLQRYIQHHTVHAVRELRAHRIDLALGSSGTIENLADIALRMSARRRLQRNDVVSYKDLKQAIMKLGTLSLAERRQVPGINPERADIIIAGAAILDVLMRELALPAIQVSDRGLRDGLLADYLLRHGHTPLLDGMSVRERSVLQLGRACHFDAAHGCTTARLAQAVFHSARTAGLHTFGAWECELLAHAAMLHRIGTFLTYNDYQAHSAYFIRNANLLGFDQTEIAIIAATALYHRKAMPHAEHPEFAALDRRAQKIVLVLCVLLRLAESLDRSHAGLVQQACLSIQGASQAVLTLYSAADCQIEIWAVERHREAFRKVFGRSLDITVQPPALAPATLWAAETPAASYGPVAVALPAMPLHPA
jgi:exopolyphosphatase/guanosine-5'-triphosphate,3'-diphosphate pyrophosphatase